MVYVSKSEKETAAIGCKLGESLRGGEIITLSGELGAGKTVFAKGIARGLSISDTVVSPTFTLMNEYEGRFTLYHYDAYRIADGDEAREAGLTEYFGKNDGVCVIEWWENIVDVLESFSKITVNISYKDENTRLIEIAYK